MVVSYFQTLGSSVLDIRFHLTMVIVFGVLLNNKIGFLSSSRMSTMRVSVWSKPSPTFEAQRTPFSFNFLDEAFAFPPPPSQGATSRSWFWHGFLLSRCLSLLLWFPKLFSLSLWNRGLVFLFIFLHCLKQDSFQSTLLSRSLLWFFFRYSLAISSFKIISFNFEILIKISYFLFPFLPLNLPTAISFKK